MSDTKHKPCTRFEKHGMLLAERGQQLDEHYQDCSDCVEAMRAYRALGELIAGDSDSKPAPGWQEAVLREVRQTELEQQDSEPQTFEKTRSSRPWLSAIAAGVAALGIASVFLYDSTLMQDPTQSLQANSLELVLVASDNDYRGNDAKIGDNLSLRSTVDKPEKALLRVYREGQLHFTCGRKKGCTFKDQRLEQLVELSAYGEYQAIIFLDKVLVNEASVSMDADVLDAIDSDNEVIISESLIVR